MSYQNTLPMKARRRVARRLQKAIAARVIPFLGFTYSKQVIKQQRYNRYHGLPYSETVANIRIGTIGLSEKIRRVIFAPLIASQKGNS